MVLRQWRGRAIRPQQRPLETHNLVKDKKAQKLLLTMRQAMVDHLSVRGDEWIKDGKLILRTKRMLYSPNYPKGK